MIVKIQQSLAGNTTVKQMLIYNETKSLMYEENLSKGVELLLRGRPKAYFEVNVTSEGTLNILDEVEEQDW